MAVRRFPIEAGHLLAFARAIGDTSDAYSDSAAAETGSADVAVPPTFLIASAQFDPDYPLRPKPGEPWFGSGATPSGLRPDSGAAQRVADGTDSGKPESEAAGGGVLHAEQRFEFVRPVRVGDVLSATSRPGRVWEKEGRKGGKLVFAESVTEYRDERGELVATATAVGVRTARVPGGAADKGRP